MNNSNLSTLANTTDNAIEYSSDFYNIASRASYILSRPYYIIALIFGTLAIIANISSLAAIYQIRKSMPSQFRILISLLASDLVIDFSFMCHISNNVIHPPYQPGYGSWQYRLKSRCSYMIIKALNNTGLNITLLNLMAMAIDHYIAILMPFKKMKLMSKRRTNIMIVILWTIAVLSGFSDFFSPITAVSWVSTNATNLNFCELIWLSDYQEEFIMFGIVIVCMLSMLYMYLHIYCEIKGKTKRDTVNDIKAHRNNRALVTTLFILGTFAVCWLPICIFNVALIIITRCSMDVVHDITPLLTKIDRYLYDLMLLNTLCDPIIYTIRMDEVRRGYFLLFNRFFSMNSRFSHVLWNSSRRQSMFESYASSTYVSDESKRTWIGSRMRTDRDLELSSRLEETRLQLHETEPLTVNGTQ